MSRLKATGFSLRLPMLLFFVMVASNARLSYCLGESVETNACVLGQAPMYCTCDSHLANEARLVSCVFMDRTTPGDPVWVSFENQKGIVDLTLTAMLHARLTFLPSNTLRQMANLTMLTVKEFNMDSLWPYSFENMTSLRNISMENCGINALERYAIAFLPNLRMISLANNKLTRIPADSLYRLPKLKLLHLERNEIITVDELVFVDMPMLEELTLYDNWIDRITPKTFVGLTSLQRLYLYSNKLYRLVDGVFSGAPQLRELDLRNNLIEMVNPHAFDGLNNLTSLLLNNNKIRTLPKHVFKGAPNLRVVDLTNNDIIVLQQALLRPLRHSHDDHFLIFIRDNPLVCTCDLLWINEYVTTVKSFLFRKELNHLKCHLNNSTQKIVKTTPADLLCSETALTTKVASKSKKTKQKLPSSTNSYLETTTEFSEEAPHHEIVWPTSNMDPNIDNNRDNREEIESVLDEVSAESTETEHPNFAPSKNEDDNGGQVINVNVLLISQCVGVIYLFHKTFFTRV